MQVVFEALEVHLIPDLARLVLSYVDIFHLPELQLTLLPTGIDHFAVTHETQTYLVELFPEFDGHSLVHRFDIISGYIWVGSDDHHHPISCDQYRKIRDFVIRNASKSSITRFRQTFNLTLSTRLDASRA